MSPPDPGLETSGRDVTEKLGARDTEVALCVLGVLPSQVAPEEQEALTGMGAAWLLPSPQKCSAIQTGLDDPSSATLGSKLDFCTR